MRTDEQTELHPQHRREVLTDPHDPSIEVPVTAISLADSPDGTPTGGGEVVQLDRWRK